VTAVLGSASPNTAATVRTNRVRRRRRQSLLVGLLAAALFAVVAVTLMVGNTFYSPDHVLRVVLGEQVPGASFTVGELRLPRATLGMLAGFAFGAAGLTFQTMLRNPLASPDIIGISTGASAAAVVGIVVLSLNETAVSLLALGGALITALVIYALSWRRGFAGARLILIGIGIAAMLHSVVSYVLTRAAAWDIQAAMQWLTGSLNGATWDRVAPLAIAVLIVVPLLVWRQHDLDLLRLGDDAAAGLGVRLRPVRLLLILAAVALIAFATAAAGPIAFVAFMAGPIAARITASGTPLLVTAGLVGALLVVGGDLVGQFALGTRYPVGVITGVVGAPFLTYLLVRSNRSGASL
jgi:iron complex transport system permease protein